MFDRWQNYNELVNQRRKLYRELDRCSKRNDKENYKVKLEEYNELGRRIKDLENNRPRYTK